MDRTSNKLKNMVVTGLFAAMCYILLYLKIPIPAPVGSPFLHLGNMIVILAAMLYSGWVGGLAGSIGMGLHDTFNGYASVAYKTVILKFGIGMVVGAVAARGKKEGAKKPFRAIVISGLLFLITGIVLLVTTTVAGYEIVIPGASKNLVIIPVVYLLCLVLGIGLLIVAGCMKKLSCELCWCLIGAVCGIGFNLIGEFVLGAFSKIVEGSQFAPAVLASAISLPATLINGTFSIIGAVLLYLPLSKALRRANLIEK